MDCISKSGDFDKSAECFSKLYALSLNSVETNHVRARMQATSRLFYCSGLTVESR